MKMFLNKKNRKILFTYVSEYYASFGTKNPIWPLLRGARVCMSSNQTSVSGIQLFLPTCLNIPAVSSSFEKKLFVFRATVMRPKRSKHVYHIAIHFVNYEY